jgi:hypothetical protein
MATDYQREFNVNGGVFVGYWHLIKRDNGIQVNHAYLSDEEFYFKPLDMAKLHILDYCRAFGYFDKLGMVNQERAFLQSLGFVRIY